MIQFNELRISPNADNLIIDAFIKEDSYFEDFKISNISIIHISDENNLVGNKIYDREITDDDIRVYINEGLEVLVNKNETVYIENGIRRIRLVLYTEDLGVSLREGMFKVQITCSSDSEPTYPIGYASPTITGVVLDLYPFYKNTMKYLKCFNCNCENKDLINSILIFKALEINLNLGNIEQIAYYWFKYFKNK